MSLSASTSTAAAAASYADHGIFWMRDVLSPDDIEAFREAAAQSLYDVLRALMVKQVAAAVRGDDDEAQEGSGRICYAEVMGRDGGRLDSRAGMDEAPFANLLVPGGAASRLLEPLRAAVGADMEVIQIGQIVAMARDGWETTVGAEADEDGFAHQAWHQDGRGRSDVECCTVFIPLADVSEANGATQFALGSHRWSEGSSSPDPADEEAMREASTTLCVPAGSAYAFDHRLWHRGLCNESIADRLVLYCIISRPQRHGDLKGFAKLDGGTVSLFSGQRLHRSPGFRLTIEAEAVEAEVAEGSEAEADEAEERGRRRRGVLSDETGGALSERELRLRRRISKRARNLEDARPDGAR